MCLLLQVLANKFLKVYLNKLNSMASTSKISIIPSNSMEKSWYTFMISLYLTLYHKNQIIINSNSNSNLKKEYFFNLSKKLAKFFIIIIYYLCRIWI